MRNNPEFVIVHHSASADDDEVQYEQIRWYHRSKGWADCGYHRIYERVRGVYVAISGRPLNMNGAHAPGYNTRSIGACFVGDFSIYAPSERHLHVGARDIAGLCDVLGIPTHHILPHRAVRQTACPGDTFPFGYLIELVTAYREHDGSEFGLTA